MRHRWYEYAGWIVLVVVLAACGGRATPEATPVPATAPPAGEPVTIEGMAYVDRIEILKSETPPVEITVVAMGDLPDTCTAIDAVTQGRDMAQSTLWIEITTMRTAGDDCQNTVVPFEERIPLDVYGLPAGTYAVEVNGATGMFLLAVDNAAPPLEGKADVTNVAVAVSEADPTRPVVVIDGTLPDACTQVSEVRQGIDAAQSAIWVEVLTSRPRDAACAEQVIPFAERVTLDTGGLAAGRYTVDVHGVTQPFTLTVDSIVLAPTATPTPTPTAEPTDEPTAEPTSEPTPAEPPEDDLVKENIRLSSMELRVSGSSPVQATVIAKGVLPDTCSEPGPMEQRIDLDTNTIWVTVYISHPEGATCDPATRSFEESFELDLTGLPAGTYTVDVNGIEGSIILGVSN